MQLTDYQAKFIAHSVRVYEFWGYDWWLPFWDLEMFDFWAGVPLEHRIEQRLYIDYVKKRTAEMIGDENASTLVTDRDESSNRFIRLIRRTPLEGLARLAYRKFRSKAEYESHPLASWGIIPKDVFLEYYGRGYVSRNALLASYVVDRIDLDR